MAKRGKSDEKVQADAGSLAGVPPVAEAGGAPGVDAMVDGGGGAAADAGGAEQPDGAEAPVLGVADADMGEAAGAQLVDGAADAAREAGRSAADADAPADGAVFEGVSDDEDADYCIACGEILVDGDAVYHDVSESGYLHADCCGPERESYVNADGKPLKDGEPIPEPDIYRCIRPVSRDAGGVSTVDGANASVTGDGIGHMLDAATGTDTGDGSASGVAVDLPADMIVEAAKAAANEALRFVVAYWMLPDATMAQCHVLFGAYSTAAPAMAELVRKIGTERATLEVVASQLKILGIIDDVDLHQAVRMAITVFLQALVAIEAFEATERALAEAAWAKTVDERKPLPIEDTTLEPVSDPLDTW